MSTSLRSKPVVRAPLFEISQSGEQGVRQEKFGTFHGVFRPTILTLLGIMMYLREGWVVGNAGLGGGALIILLCFAITGATALSISSIVTNIRIGSGGVFSLLSQSLGLQVGASLGFPLYLVQAFSVIMYLFGCAEAWAFLFPEHPQRLVLLSVFGLVFFLSIVGAKLAFRVQLVVMAGVLLSLTSIFFGLAKAPQWNTPVLWGNFEDGNFWYLFSIYFPAATGILVGSSMSGNLKDPKRNIPKGTLLAWGVALLVYLSLALWYSLIATPQELRYELLTSAKQAYFPQVVLFGITLSCFTAALSSIVAAPRVMQALAEYDTLPAANFLKRLSKKGEPRNATFLTGLLALTTILFSPSLNSIAPLITQLSLVIYFMVNAVLFIEQQLNLVSFRPSLRLPRLVPLGGAVLSLAAMLIISPLLSLLSFLLVAFFYFYLSRQQLGKPWETTVESGLFGSLARWCAQQVYLRGMKVNKRIWKPDLAVPLREAKHLKTLLELLRALTYSQGSLQFLVFKDKVGRFSKKKLQHTIAAFRHTGLLASCAELEETELATGLATALSVMRGAFFNPNTLFLLLEKVKNNKAALNFNQLYALAKKQSLALVVLALHTKLLLGDKKEVVLWVKDQSPNWKISLNLTNLDYAILIGFQLKKNWQGRLLFYCVGERKAHLEVTQSYLKELVQLARLGEGVEIKVEQGNFLEKVAQNKRGALQVFGLSEEATLGQLHQLAAAAGSSCLFVRDSGAGLESALV